MTLAFFLLVSMLFSTPGFGARGTLELMVEGKEAEIAEGWVSVVRADQAFSDPSFETAVRAGDAFTLRLSPGRYYVATAAIGGEVLVRPVNLVDAEVTRLAVSLEAAPRVTGVIYDARGIPLSGASVSQVRAVLDPWLGFFSERALKVLSSGWTTTTDEQGRWYLPASSREVIPGVATSHQKRPAFFSIRPGIPPADLMLTEGRSLSLQILEPDSAILLRLEPVHASHLWEDVAPQWTEAVLTRRSTPNVTWRSLPPGRYRLMEIRTDHVAPKSSELLIDLRGSSLNLEYSHTNIEQGSPPVAAAFIASERLSTRNELNLFVGGISTRHLIRATPGGSRILWNGSPAPSGVHATTLDNIFVIDPTSNGAIAELAKYERADITLRIVQPKNDPPLEKLRLTFEECTTGSPSYDVTISDKSILETAIPSSCGTMLITAPPYQSHRLQHSIAALEHRDLNDLHLEPGARVDLLTTTQAGEPRSRTVLVTSGEQDAERETVLRTTTAPDGSAELAGLPANERLHIAVTDPSSGYSGDFEIKLQPLEQRYVNLILKPPATVVASVSIDRELLTLAPDAAVEYVQLIPQDRTDSRMLSTKVVESEAIFDRVVPGTWRLTALLRIGGTLHPIRSGAVTVESGERKEAEILVAPLLFRGRVVRSGVGVMSQISVADIQQAGAIRRTIRTLPDGTFSLLLPEEGYYHVDVTPLAEENIRLGVLEFRNADVPVILELPTGSLTIRVTSAGKSAASGLMVSVKQLRPGLPPLVRGGRTDSEGTLLLRNMPAGEWIINADGLETLQRSIVLGSGPASLSLALP